MTAAINLSGGGRGQRHRPTRLLRDWKDGRRSR